MIAAKFIFMCPGIAGLSFAWGVALADQQAVADWSHPAVSANAAVVSNLPRTNSPAAKTTTRLHRSNDGMFYVTALIKGVPVRFLVDTGATLVVLTSADAKRIGIDLNDVSATETMQTAAGPSAIKRVTLDKVRVAGRNMQEVDAAVVSKGLGVSLIGQNLLSRLGSITLTGDEIHLS